MVGRKKTQLVNRVLGFTIPANSLVNYENYKFLKICTLKDMKFDMDIVRVILNRNPLKTLYNLLRIYFYFYKSQHEEIMIVL